MSISELIKNIREKARIEEIKKGGNENDLTVKTTQIDKKNVLRI